MTSGTTQAQTDVVVVGGGLIGLASAWRVARAGGQVTVVDHAFATGASRVAAGMVAPVTEVAYGEEELLRLTIASARAWPTFAEELEGEVGEPIGYQQLGTLLVGFDADDAVVLDELHRFQGELGVEAERIRSRECRRREPLLSPRVRGGLVAHEDHQVDPRRVMAALRRAGAAAGVREHVGRVERIDHDGDRVTGVTLADGGRLAAPRVVLAAGPWSGGDLGLPDEVVPPVRPVKGQILVLRSLDGDPVLSMTVRGLVKGRHVYLVPRGDGRVVVGATQEERGFDTTVTAGATRQLLDDAAALVPYVDELELVETIAGLRPGTPDNRPLIGATALEGLVLATGHHRHGVLLTPITAEAVATLVQDGVPDPVLEVADPRRPAVARRGASTPDRQEV